MKRIFALLFVALCFMPVAANAQTRLLNYDPGPRLINGTQLNKAVAAINNMQGFGTPAAGTFNTLTINGSTALTCASYQPDGTPAATDKVFFIATRAFRVVTASEVHSVAAGGASALQVTKDSTTAAPGAGTDLLTNNTNTGFDLNATANTVQAGTLVATAGVTTLAIGDRLAVDYANTIQSTAGVVVTVCMAPI